MLCLLLSTVLLVTLSACTVEHQPVTGLGKNDVLIADTAIIMPVNKIVLARKDNQYCAIKITDKSYRIGRYNKHHTAEYAHYVSYYQGDGTGVFAKGDVQVTKGELSNIYFPVIGRFALKFGDDWIKCGPMKVSWNQGGVINFSADNNYEAIMNSVELTPTPWSDISMVNVYDPRIRWYKYGAVHKDIQIPVDELWKESKKHEVSP